MMEMVLTTGAIRYAKLQSNCHHQQVSIELFTGWLPFLSPTNSVKALKGNSIIFHVLAHHKLTWDSSKCVFVH